MRRLIACWLVNAVAIALAMSAACAHAAPSDAPSFTRYVADQLHRSMPGLEVAVKGDLALQAGSAPSATTSFSLERLYDACMKERSACDEAVERFVALASEVMREKALPPDRDRIRLAVRPADYVEQARQGLGNDALFSRPLAPGLAVVPVLDLEKTVRPVGKTDLDRLELTQDGLFDAARRNLRSVQRPLAEVAPLPQAGAIGTIRDDGYAASRLVFHDDWAPLAAGLGKLVVMAPTPEVVLYGAGDTPIAIDALRTLGTEIASRTPRHLPLVVLEWTRDGWQELQ